MQNQKLVVNVETNSQQVPLAYPQQAPPTYVQQAPPTYVQQAQPVYLEPQSSFTQQTTHIHSANPPVRSPPQPPPLPPMNQPKQTVVVTNTQYQAARSPTSYHPPHPGTQSYTTVTQTTVSRNGNVSGLRKAIPALPMPLAITLCVVNILLPGLGTIIAGFSVLCCGNTGQSNSGRFGTFCINLWVGLAQLCLAFFVAGWIWSVMWGVAFIIISAEDKKSKQEEHVTTTTSFSNPVPAPHGFSHFPPK